MKIMTQESDNFTTFTFKSTTVFNCRYQPKAHTYEVQKNGRRWKTRLEVVNIHTA